MSSTRTVAVLLAAATLTATGILVAGPITPPGGPVASSYKTLTEVEPRIAVNATNTPGNGVTVYRISQPGSYYLTGNVTGISGMIGIQIAASNVTLDLNGFTLQGVSGADDAISVAFTGTAFTNVHVRNGTIRGWTKEGVDGFYANNSIVENVHVDGSVNGFGIITGAGSTIRDCVVTASGVGIVTPQGCTVTGCTAFANTSGNFGLGPGNTVTNCTARDSVNSGNAGFNIGDGSTVANCTATGNNGNGFSIGNNCTVTGSTSLSNTSVGFRVNAGGLLQACTAASNGAYGIFAAGSATSIIGCSANANAIDGIRVASNCLVVNNLANGNGPTAGIGGAGIYTTGTGNRLDSNTTTGNWWGIALNGSNNFMVRNLSTGNVGGPNQLIAGNRQAQIINNPPANFVSTDPWANFQY
ncbi:MAG: right-handed parallel beta-helix repeat-containing protein [Phycisphaerales bacterium]